MRHYILLMFVFSCFAFNTKAQCNTPTLSILAIVADSVSLSWTTSGSVTNVEYAVLPASASQPTSGTTSTGTSAGVGGLSAGTAYKAWIKANCPGSPSSSTWSSTSFSTPCGVPSTITVSNVQGDSADISWTAVSPGANYQYVVDLSSAPPASGTGVSANSTRVKGLLPAKTYYVFVRTDCGGGSYSFWSASQSFYTKFTTSITKSLNNEMIAISPNPATNMATITVQNYTPDSKITVYNASGSVITSMPVTTAHTQLDVNLYPTGVYIVKYADANRTYCQKLLKH
jgi:hypothetical protein